MRCDVASFLHALLLFISLLVSTMNFTHIVLITKGGVDDIWLYLVTDEESIKKFIDLSIPHYPLNKDSSVMIHR